MPHRFTFEVGQPLQSNFGLYRQFTITEAAEEHDLSQLGFTNNLGNSLFNFRNIFTQILIKYTKYV